MLPGEVELSERTLVPGGKVLNDFSGPTGSILSYIKTCIYLFTTPFVSTLYSRLHDLQPRIKRETQDRQHIHCTTPFPILYII